MYSVIFFIAAMIISMIVGSVLAIPLTLTYGLAGLVIGQFIQMGKSRTATYIAGSFALLITLIMQYILAVVLFKMNFIDEVIHLTKESFQQSVNMLTAMGQTVDPKMIESFDQMFILAKQLTPSLFVMTAMLAALFIELVSYPIVKRFGVKVPGWKPFRQLMFPKSILWYYLFTLIASLFFKIEEGSYWYTVLLNLSFILQMLMVVQGLSFIFYLCERKNIAKAVPILAVVLTFMLPIFLSIVRILGIIDLGFDLRKRLEQT